MRIYKNEVIRVSNGNDVQGEHLKWTITSGQGAPFDPHTTQ